MAPLSGTLSVERANLFELLRGSLYAGDDVVLRELVSNAADAIAKRRELHRLGRADAPGPGHIDVVVDPARGTLSVIDDGVGMTADEVDRYLNEIAFSGAADFVSRHQEATGEHVIGQFGVGFYSAFMIADRVEVDTLSCSLDAVAAQWVCGSDMAFRLGPGSRAEVGTTVTLHLDPASPYLAGPEPTLAALRRHTPFLPIPVHVTVRAGDGSGVDNATSILANDAAPVWRRAATGPVDDAELNAFYREHFADEFDPLLTIPVASLELGLRGVIFVRDTRGGQREVDGHVDVLRRGITIGRDVPGLVPKYLEVQSVILECDALPLVASRGGIRDADLPEGVPDLVRESLTQSVLLRLYGMFTEERERYEALWPEIGPFVKYGALTDRTFSSVMARRLLLETLDGELLTLHEFRERAPGSLVLYASDRDEQGLLIEAHRRAGIPAILLDHVIDQPLLRALEAGNRDVRFQRLDADPVGVLGDAGANAAQPDVQAGPGAGSPDTGARLAALIADLERHATVAMPGCRVRGVALGDPDLAVLLTHDESSRRVGEAAQLVGLASGQRLDAEGLVERALVVNVASDLVARVAAMAAGPTRDLAVAHLVDLALLGNGDLTADARIGMLRRSQLLLDRVARLEGAASAAPTGETGDPR